MKDARLPRGVRAFERGIRVDQEVVREDDSRHIEGLRSRNEGMADANPHMGSLESIPANARLRTAPRTPVATQLITQPDVESEMFNPDFACYSARPCRVSQATIVSGHTAPKTESGAQ